MYPRPEADRFTGSEPWNWRRAAGRAGWSSSSGSRSPRSPPAPGAPPSAAPAPARRATEDERWICPSSSAAAGHRCVAPPAPCGDFARTQFLTPRAAASSGRAPPVRELRRHRLHQRRQVVRSPLDLRAAACRGRRVARLRLQDRRDPSWRARARGVRWGRGRPRQRRPTQQREEPRGVSGPAPRRGWWGWGRRAREPRRRGVVLLDLGRRVAPGSNESSDPAQTR